VDCKRPEAVLLWLGEPVTNRTRDRCEMRMAKCLISHSFISALIENVRPTRPMCLPRTLSTDAHTLGRRPLTGNKAFHLAVICPPACRAEKESVFISGILCDAPPPSPLSTSETRFPENELCRKPTFWGLL
jgi:hypothetical protein